MPTILLPSCLLLKTALPEFRDVSRQVPADGVLPPMGPSGRLLSFVCQLGGSAGQVLWDAGPQATTDDIV